MSVQGRSVRLLAAAWAALAASACARSSQLVRQAVVPDRGSYATAILNVTAADGKDFENERRTFESLALARLTELRIFSRITLGDSSVAAGDALKITARVVGVRKVGAVQRFMFGALAGRASMQVDVDFSEQASGRPLGSFTVKGETGSTGYSGGTPEALTRAAEQVAKLTAVHFAPRQP